MLVHASFAFVHAVERGSALKEPLRSAVDAILECGFPDYRDGLDQIIAEWGA